MRILSFVLVHLLLLLLCINGTQAWGSARIRKKPRVDFADTFPETPSVVLVAGQSFVSAQQKCNDVAGVRGYCHIQLAAVPIELDASKKNEYNGLQVTRSRTMVSAKPEVTLTRQGDGTFVSIISNVKWVVLHGLSIKGHSSEESVGVLVSGFNIRYIVVRNCRIFDFNAESDAHGIGVYGTGKKPVRHVSISNNTVYNMRTGSSESIVLNGFVTLWEIKGNVLQDINNIGIDAIGGEGVFPPKKKGRRLPSVKDSARFGYIENNVVKRMSTVTNSQYGSEHSWAAGIYVDGGRDILIRGNMVESAEWGYEIGAENCVITRNIIMEDNIARNNYFGDLVIGGYAAKGYKRDRSIVCDPKKTVDDDEGHGYVQRVTIRNNLFETDSPKEDDIVVQYRTTFAIIAQSGVSPINEDGNGSAKGDANAIRITFP